MIVTRCMGAKPTRLMLMNDLGCLVNLRFGWESISPLDRQMWMKIATAVIDQHIRDSDYAEY